jgi:hypothetical protein
VKDKAASELEMKANENEGGEQKLDTAAPGDENALMELDNPKWADRNKCLKCAKILEIVASVLGGLFILAALVVGIRGNP